MPRVDRVDVGGEIYHVINRANARVRIFDDKKDYQLFDKVLKEAKDKINMRIYTYSIMPNHWHLVVSPKKSGDLSKFMGWLTMTHTQRWHSAHKTTGSGHLYQGRYKSFIIQNDPHFLQVCRYVERNSLRAKLVKLAENWRWSSLWRREKGSEIEKKLLDDWPVSIPGDYLHWVNEKEEEKELQTIRHSVNKGKPYGSEHWVEKVVKFFKLESTLRSPGRPKKGS